MERILGFWELGIYRDGVEIPNRRLEFLLELLGVEPRNIKTAKRLGVHSVFYYGFREMKIRFWQTLP